MVDGPHSPLGSPAFPLAVRAPPTKGTGVLADYFPVIEVSPAHPEQVVNRIKFIGNRF